MLFHTYVFAIFFAVTYAGYYLLKKTRFWVYWLLVASYVFYGWWNPLYLFLILYSTSLDYFAVRMMMRTERRKIWLALSVVNNLLLLGFFKYGAFAAENLTGLFAALGVPITVPAPGALLPVGISFYVFQSMSYTIDFYRGRLEPERNFFRYAAFVSLFPQLVAGPIERASNLLPQLRSERRVTWENVTDGLTLFVLGLFKKVALADFLAIYVNEVYGNPAGHDGLAMVMATYAFAWQIYFDFSGYTDMARGVARMMGINLMVNFNHPYLATSLRDFWQRWHISLSTWFKDYVYIPLGGNRGGKFNTYRNMFLTMVISGLWHGAAWNFVLWGFVHAVGRLLTTELEKTEFYRKIPKIIKQIWIYHFVCVTWIFFRAESLADSVLILKTIARFGLTDPRVPLVAALFCAGVWAYQFVSESGLRRVFEYAPVRVATMVCLLLYILFFVRSSGQQFIYFQF